MSGYVLRMQEAAFLTFLKDLTPFKDILLVEGVRQTGKTTLNLPFYASKNIPQTLDPFAR